MAYRARTSRHFRLDDPAGHVGIDLVREPAAIARSAGEPTEQAMNRPAGLPRAAPDHGLTGTSALASEQRLRVARSFDLHGWR